MKHLGYLLILSSFLFYSSCRNDTRLSYRHDLYMNRKFSEYKLYYSAIKDTLTSWKKDSLLISQYWGYVFDSKLDSMIVFNSDSTKFVANILLQDRYNRDAVFDYIELIGGSIVDKDIYIYIMSNITIDRAAYQDSIHQSMSFIELSYLARENLNSAFLINEDGSIQSEDLFFEFMYNRKNFGLPVNSTLIQFDSAVVSNVLKLRRNKINYMELKEIQNNIGRTSRAAEPELNKSLWQKWFGEKKLFESQEWKDYLKQKYGK